MLFDFGYTLFAHAPLAETIRNCARRSTIEMTDEIAAALAHRIDHAAMTPEELAFPRDFDAAVWSQRWKVLYGIADEFCPAVKPDPKIFAVACESLGLTAGEVLMVGDDPRSDAGAVAAGIRTMLLPPGPLGSDNGLDAVRCLST